MRTLTPRQRLLLRTSVLSLVLLGAMVAFILHRNPASRYQPEVRVEGITADLERKLPSDSPKVTFRESSQEVGLNFHHFFKDRSTQLPEDMGSGAAWGDYDNDGDDDLFIVNIDGPLTLTPQEREQSPARCQLYRNNGNGTFTDVTDHSRLALKIVGMGAAWGDFDGDGWLDLVVTSYPDLYLFHNNHDGTFTDLSSQSGLNKFKGFWAGASWADYDRDGDLDLYICGYVQYLYRSEDAAKASMQFEAEVPFTLNPSSYPPQPNLLLRNDGKGKFTDVARQAGVDNPTGRSLSAAWCDFDGDGWLDLYVANDVSDNAMYKNLGNGSFKDVSHSAWVADYRGAMGLAIGDWDGDGDFDIFVTHWLAQENALFSNMLIGSRGAAPGKMVFMDVADQEGLGQISLDYVKWGTSFFDYDNDGRPDLLVVDGSTFQDEKDKRKLIPMPHMLFWNKGEAEGFFEVSSIAGDIFKQRTVGRGAAFADYDHDGDIDVVVVNHSGQAWLLRNEGGNKSHWLDVKVRGKKNVFALGTIVRVTLGDRTQLQQIGSQPSYLSQNSLTAHFGLGRSEKADRVEVIFPGGKTVVRQDIPCNQTLSIEEP
ncbi:MAG: CRTAC1 family protein [Terriglobia bacterium]